MDARAFAVWLPKIANVHALAFHFRTALLDLALDHSTGCTPTLKEVTILIVEENDALRAEHAAVARGVAPNATILCTGCYVAARDLTLARMESGSPVHLVLAGACVDEEVQLGAAVQVRALKDFIGAIDPRKGIVHIDMRERPLIAAVQPEGMCAQLFRVGVDTALPGGRVTDAALLTLLDFICEQHLGQCTANQPPIDELSAADAAEAALACERILAMRSPVPTPVASRIAIAFEPPSEEPSAMAAAQASQASEQIWVKRIPLPTPVAARSIVAEEVILPPCRQISGQPHRASIGNGGAVPSQLRLPHAAPVAQSTNEPLPPHQARRMRPSTAPILYPICESESSNDESSGIIQPKFRRRPRAASLFTAKSLLGTA